MTGVMRSIILLSGGLDSAVALKWALDRGPVLRALTFNYGQRAVRRELAAARAMCRRLGVAHEAVRLNWLEAITQSALVSPAESLPRPATADLDNPAEAEQTARAVWVPNRNAVFVAIAASFAEALGADTVVAGFNAEEGASFPDNRAAFVTAMNRVLTMSTLSKVRVRAPTQRLSKPAIAALGRRIHAPIDLAWSCYLGGPKPCGVCESCRRFQRAVAGRRENS